MSAGATAEATARHRNDANRRYLELQEELERITRKLNDLFAFWATLDTPNHPKRRDLTGDRVAEIEAAEDELEALYRERFKEFMEVRERVTHLEYRRGRWEVVG